MPTATPSTAPTATPTPSATLTATAPASASPSADAGTTPATPPEDLAGPVSWFLLASVVVGGSALLATAFLVFRSVRGSQLLPEEAGGLAFLDDDADATDDGAVVEDEPSGHSSSHAQKAIPASSIRRTQPGDARRTIRTGMRADAGQDSQLCGASSREPQVSPTTRQPSPSRR